MSDYRPSDFKLMNSVRPVGALMDTHAAKQLAELAKTRGTSMPAEIRRMAGEYFERELPKLQAEKTLARVRKPSADVRYTTVWHSIKEPTYERNITATVIKARLMELSLVTTPCDQRALITSRSAPPPHLEFYNTAISAVEKLQQLTRLYMKEKQHGPAAHPA